MPEPRKVVRRTVPSFARYASLAARALRDGVAPGGLRPEGAEAPEGTADGEGAEAEPLEQAAWRVALAVPARRGGAEARPGVGGGPYGAPAPAPARRTVDRRC